MKLASFRRGTDRGFGIVVDGGIVDLSRSLGVPDLKSALAVASFDELQRHACRAASFPIESVSFLPPIVNPDKIICIGVNYHSHLAEIGMAQPDYPMIFLRFANTQMGHDEPLVRPRVSEQFDYEGELAIVIGKRARYLKRENALEAVAGYACYNEGTIRDWQSHTRQVSPGKNFPATAGFGPYLVTKDEIGDPAALNLITRLNGEVVQHATLDDMIFDVASLVAYCSTFTELVPGDVISTGTTGGVGAYRKPPLWMKPGDVAEVEISGVGILRNSVVAE